MKLFHRSRCYNGGNRHHFEPRYTEKPTYPPGGFKAWKLSEEGIRNLFVIKEYIHDICVWCGKTIKHNE